MPIDAAASSAPAFIAAMPRADLGERGVNRALFGLGLLEPGRGVAVGEREGPAFGGIALRPIVLARLQVPLASAAARLQIHVGKVRRRQMIGIETVVELQLP